MLSGVLVVSCSEPQESTQTTLTGPAGSTGVTPVATTASPAVSDPKSEERPQYGGQIILGLAYNVVDHDEISGFFGPPELNTIQLTNEELLVGDWTKGPAGTNETNFAAVRTQFEAGAIAESWDFSQLAEGVMVFKIRQGIHFALNTNSEASRLVAGRELTADDVVFSLKQAFTNTKAYLYGAYPDLRSADIAALDRYTVRYQCAPASVSNALLRVTECVHVVAPEVVQKYGSMADWRTSVGSGPFMLTDVVGGSSVTFGKNPNYWGKDPIGPGKGNQLPYVDGVKALIIPDLSTRQAAMRTGRTDVLGSVNWEDGPILIKQISGVEYVEGGRSGAPAHTAMRTDKAPYSDIRVRRALLMGIDFNAMSGAIFGPDARILTWPIGYMKEYADAYLGLDDPECPASIKELYTYNPEKAKQLLKEAGYPNGFKTSVIFDQANNTITDMYSVFKEQWAKINVDLTLAGKEYAVWTNIYRARSFDDMVYGTSSPIANLYQCASFRGPTMNNPSYVGDDPKVEEARTKMLALALTDAAQADKIHKELMKYVLDQAWMIPTPGPVTYTLFQSWLRTTTVPELAVSAT
jgi:peptide/nickel transport system substrate-binding protein